MPNQYSQYCYMNNVKPAISGRCMCVSVGMA